MMFGNFKSLLNLKNEVTIYKTIQASDGMGGTTTTTTSVILSRAAIWQVGANSRFITGKYALTSTHVLCFPYGEYNFNEAITSGTFIETVTWNSNTYTVDGFADNVMNMNEIITQGLQRTT